MNGGAVCVKREYVEAEIEIVILSAIDIMTASDPGLEDEDWIL